MEVYPDAERVKSSTPDLINLIYQAALQPDLWSKILINIQILCGTNQCTFFYYDALEPAQCFANAAHANEEILSRYLKDFIYQQAKQINNELKALPEGQVVTNQDIRHFAGKEYSGIVGTDYMQTFWPNLKFEAGIILLRGETRCAGLGLQNFMDSSPIPPQSISLLQIISPHLCQAIYLHQHFRHYEQNTDALKLILQKSKIGIILLDEKLSVHFINRTATLSLGKIDNLPVAQSLALEKISKEQIQKIVMQFNSLAKGDNRNNKSDLTLPYKNGHLKINGYVLHRSQHITAADSEAGYLLLIQDSNPCCDLDIQYLHAAYDITAAEYKLISGLINGVSLLENADIQSVKPSTIRWHLKNIMQKTLTHSQTELARLMLELSD